ncbi:MAG: hypothetical protein WA912_10145 [Ornithinimicrobium sp.]
MNHWSQFEDSSAMHDRQTLTVQRINKGSSTRRAAARAKTSLAAARAGVAAEWVWQLKGDPVLQQEFRQCDTILSRDVSTDRALALVADLTAGQTVIRSDGRASATGESVWAAALRWYELVEEVGTLLEPPVDREALEQFVRSADTDVASLVEVGVPWLFAPVAHTLQMMHDGLYWAPGTGAGDSVVARVGMRLLRGGPFWASGSLDAIDRWVRLRTQWSELDESDLRQVSDQALAAAEAARSIGNHDAARCHLLASMNVTFHRARHPQRRTSTLVDDTRALLDPLVNNHTRRCLTDGSMPRPGEQIRARGGLRDKPQVVILPGPYGQFHTDLAEALEPVSQVTISELRARRAPLRRRRPLPMDLWLLAALRQGRVDLGKGTLDGAEINDPVLRHLVRSVMLLKIELSHHDVVVADWGAVQAFWASHVCPAGTRLVIRWHSLDLFDSWLHLLDWRGVDEVLVSHGAFASLFQDLTHGLGAPAPAIEWPYLPRLGDFHQPKLPDARFTLGLVGWGRMVKDASFAVDLMEADPRRRLVLIGPPFPETRDPSVQEYIDTLMARIRSPKLAERITVVGPTDDVPRHLRAVGVIVSCSFREGWHMGLIEGVASGAVPVLRDWPMLARRGAAASIYPKRWIVQDVAEADAAMAAVADEAAWFAASASATAELAERLNPDRARTAYQRRVLGD